MLSKQEFQSYVDNATAETNPEGQAIETYTVEKFFHSQYIDIESPQSWIYRLGEHVHFSTTNSIMDSLHQNREHVSSIPTSVLRTLPLLQSMYFSVAEALIDAYEAKTRQFNYFDTLSAKRFFHNIPLLRDPHFGIGTFFQQPIPKAQTLPLATRIDGMFATHTTEFVAVSQMNSRRLFPLRKSFIWRPDDAPEKLQVGTLCRELDDNWPNDLVDLLDTRAIQRWTRMPTLPNVRN